MRVSAPPPPRDVGERVCECAVEEEEYKSAAAWCGGKGYVWGHTSVLSLPFCPRIAYNSLILIRVRALNV